MGQTFGSTLAILLVFGAVIVAAVVFFMKNRKAQQQLREYEEACNTIHEEVREVCELALIRKDFKSVVSVDVDKKLPYFDVHIPGTSRKFAMSYSGTIVCGFDLSGVNISRDEILSNKIKITLPPSKILDCYADVKSFNIQIQDAGLLAPNIKIEEQNEWVAADVAEHGQRAIRNGLLLHADKKARQLLMTRLRNRGLNDSFELEVLTLNGGNVRQLNPPQ